MADNAPTTSMADHRSTYHGFITGTVALSFICIFVLVGLLSVAFGSTLPVLMCFVTIIGGTIATIIDAKTGSKYWILSLGFLVIMGLLTAMNIS